MGQNSMNKIVAGTRAVDAGVVEARVVEALILDLLEYLEARPRTYEEVMEAWRTSCPRLPVWEDASDRGLVAVEAVKGRSIVKVMPLGVALLERHRI
jgi:hypothetical protein